MGAADDGLDTAATVAQLAGAAASHLSMANVGGLISMIVKLAQTARQNKKECEQLAARVRMISDLLPDLQGMEEKAMRAPLERLAATLREALELVKSCQRSTMIGRVFKTDLQASKLADVQRKIDSDLLDFTFISHIAIIAALDGIRIAITAASKTPTSVPPSSPATPPAVPAKAAKDDITWVEVAAANPVTVVSKSAGGTVVYKATLQDGRHVAIKSFEGGNEAAFRAELAVVSSLRHQHIVRLLCWWEGDGKRLLVYEYVADGTLREHLRRGECASWSARMEVVLAAARAIEHLHCHAIVHRNVGSSNILLDAGLKPCVSGFGASVVDAAGSRTGRIEAAAADVRGFGVVMLEVLTGREPVVRIWILEGA
jgi:serine/threonine protein kinase